MEANELELWTDGSCYPNPGPGGWAYLLARAGNKVSCDSGAVAHATNNTMELMAVIKGLQATNDHLPVTVVSDSAYVVFPFTKNWIWNWEKRGWRKYDHSPVANLELWVQLAAEVRQRAHVDATVSWRLVKGHTGIGFNEIVDHMAAEVRKEGVLG